MATYKIIGQRHLRKYTAPRTSPVYAAEVDVRNIVTSLCDVPWEKVVVRDAAMTYHTEEAVGDGQVGGLDMNVKIRDEFDAALFCAGHVGGQHRAYANAAAYVYELPDAAVGTSVVSLRLDVTSDPYNSNGARIHVMTNSTGVIPTNCRFCRGEDASGEIIDDGTTASRVAMRTVRTIDGEDYWYPTNTSCTLTPSDGLTLQKYLIVFVLMESYATVRGNWIEGCSYIKNLIEIETDSPVQGWTDGETIDLSKQAAREFNVCRDGVLPLLSSSQSGLKSITLQKSGDEFVSPRIISGGTSAANAFMKVDANIASVITELDGPVTSIDVQQPVGGKFQTSWMIGQFAVITGKFSKGTFTGLPGFLIYDVWRAKLIEDIPLTAGFDGNLVEAARHGLLRGGFTHCEVASATSLRVYAFALFEHGAMVTNGKINAFASFQIYNDSGEITEPQVLNTIYSSSVNCHFLVNAKTDQVYGYTFVETLCLSNGRIMRAPTNFQFNFPSNGIPYVGEIHSIRPLPSNGTFRFLVSGNLTSVGGVSCKNCAIVSYTTSTATVTVPDFDDLITPDTYESFEVSAEFGRITANAGGSYMYNNGTEGIYMVSGAFNALSGDTALKKAVVVMNETLIQESALADSSKVIGAALINGGQILYGNGERTSGGVEVYDAADLHTNVTPVQSCIGLRTLYAKLFNGDLYSIGKEAVGSNERIGAGFVVKTGSVTVNAISGTTYSEITVPVWQMTLSALVVPFSIPQDFNASRIRIDWPLLDATGGKLNVWLRRGEYVNDVPDIKNPELYTGAVPAVDGWELVGTLSPDDETATFDIDKLTGYCASLMFTAYISLDELNPDADMTMPQGVCTDMDVDSISGAVSGLAGSWKPDITLVE